MSSDKPKPLTLNVLEPVAAELLLVTPTTQRPPTDDELRTLGLVSRRSLYQRRKAMLAQLGDDEEPPVSTLRYFLEYMTDYDHDIPDDAIDGMREILWPGSLEFDSATPSEEP